LNSTLNFTNPRVSNIIEPKEEKLLANDYQTLADIPSNKKNRFNLSFSNFKDDLKYLNRPNISRKPINSIKRVEFGHKLKAKNRDLSTKLIINRNSSQGLCSDNYNLIFYKLLNLGTRFDSSKDNLSHRSLSIL